MSLPDEMVKCVMALSGDGRFRYIWAHFEKIDENLQTEILNPLTSTARRESLVEARAILKEEVIDLPQKVKDQVTAEQERKLKQAGHTVAVPA